MESKYSLVCHRTLTSKVENLADDRRLRLKTQLSNTDHVSVTVDIWSDTGMRGFLGITAHYTEKGGQGIQLRYNFLSCECFKGPHTAERFCELFETICNEYSIKDKLDFIICDNVVNMKKSIYTVLSPVRERKLMIMMTQSCGMTSP